jgi:hypothetical protein
MMPMITSFTNQLPKDTLPAMAQSFVFSFALGTAISCNPLVGFTTGTLAATVSLISNLSVPLFKQIWGRETEHWYEFGARSLLVFALVSGAAYGSTGIAINFIAATLMTLFIACLQGGRDRDINQASLSLVF